MAPTWPSAARCGEGVVCEERHLIGAARLECLKLFVSVIWSMLPERSNDDDDFKRIAGRVAEGLQAA
jgi:hypothetical protein